MQDRPTKTKPNLFTPIEIGPLELPNRIVMAQLTRSRAGAGNVPTSLSALCYAAAIGAELTGVRISPQNGQNDISDSDPQGLFNHVASALSGKGLSYLHVIEGDTGGVPVPPFDYLEIKRLFGGIVIANNGFDKTRANEAIEQGRADLVAFGKDFIGNPDLVARLYFDAPLNNSNRETFYGGGEQGYTDYPTLRQVDPHACYHDADRHWG